MTGEPARAGSRSAESDPPAREGPPVPGAGAPEPVLVLSNEFAEVTVRRVATHNGVRLEICSPRLGRQVRLDPLQLEALTWQEPGAYSGLLLDPFGPSPAVPGGDGAGSAGGHP